MRRTTGIVIGACTTLALAATAGAAAWRHGDAQRPVGTWHEGAPRPAAAVAPGTAGAAGGPGAAPGPVAPGADGRAPAAGPAGTGPAGAAPAVPAPAAGPGRPTRTVLPENGTLRRKVGELVTVNTVLGYVGAPRRETLRHPGASYVKVHFSRLALLPGDHVTVSDPTGAESYRYDAPAVPGTGAVDRWAMSITGDTAVVEVHRAGGLGLLDTALGGLGVTVDRVARGYPRDRLRAAPQPGAPRRDGREESVCGGDESADAVCYRSADPVAFTRSRAVARLLINGTELCTGWRVGYRNRMLTNNHCFADSASAYDTEVWFNYRCATCGGYDVVRPTKVWGDRVLATDRTHDYTLFTVENFAAVKPFGHLELDTARPARGQELYLPQHPAGDPTRIAGALGERAGTCAVVDPAYDGYAPGTDVSYYCDTEGGSSGSPVLSRRTNKVVALHHFGGCPNSGVRADLLYRRLRPLL